MTTIRATSMVTMAFLIGFAGLAAACEGSGGASNPATPRSLVQTYFEDIAQGDYAAADHLLAPSLARQYEESWDSFDHNVISLSNIQVGPTAWRVPTGPDSAFPVGYPTVHETTVTFNVQWRKVGGSTSGTQGRFVSIGRYHNSGPLLIIGIGTGP